MVLNLKAVREAHSVTQADLSRKSGISRQTIIALENDENYNVTSKTLVALADALEVAVQDLFLPEVSSRFHKERSATCLKR